MPYKDKEKANAQSRKWGRLHRNEHNISNKKWSDVHKSKGLCVKCNREAIKGHTLCEKHNTKENTRQKREYIAKKAKNICIHCSRPALKGLIICSICQNRKKISTHKWRINNHNEVITKDKAKKQKRINENRCYYCGCSLLGDEKKYCFACLAQHKIPVIKGVLKYETAD